MINIAVLGSGFIAPLFISKALEIDGYHIRCVWGRHEEKIINFKDKCDYVTTDLQKVLNDENVDVVYIALPNSLHYEYAKKALLSNKNVLLEKPFCVTSQQAKELIDISNKKGLIIYEAIMTTHTPTYREIRDYLPLIGNVKIIDANFSQFSRRYLKFKAGEIVPAFDSKLAGGSLMDLGVYNIHFVCGLFGEPNDVIYYPNIENGVDTSGVLILDYGSFKATMINAKDCSADSHVTIQAENGVISCKSTASRTANITVSTRDGLIKELSQIVNDEFVGMHYELLEFKEIFLNKDFNKVDIANKQTLLVQKVLEKAYKSVTIL